MRVIDYKKVNINKIIYKEPIKTVGGCLLSKTYYSYNQEEIPIYIQTPRLKNTSNLVVKDSKTYLELELDKKHINFYEFINNVDDHNIAKTHTRSEDWFHQKLPMDVIDDFYKTNIKMRTYNTAPIIKFKIPLYKNKNRKGCDIFGDNLQPIDISEIKKDTEVICILELQGIKFFKQRFETEWRVVQLRAYLNSDVHVPRECLINEAYLSDVEDTGEILEENISLNIENGIKNIEIDMKPKVENKINEIIKIEDNKETVNLEESTNTDTSSNTIEEESNNKPQDSNTIEKDSSNQDTSINTIEKDSSNQDTCINTIEEESNNKPEDSNTIEEEVQIEETETETDSESDIDPELNDYYSDNFSDEEEICEGLENNLEEIDFIANNKSTEEDLDTSDNENLDTSDNDEIEENTDKELHTRDNQEHKESLDEDSYENKSMNELIAEINKLKKLAFEKDEEVSKLKSKYRNLYSELNL